MSVRGGIVQITVYNVHGMVQVSESLARWVASYQITVYNVHGMVQVSESLARWVASYQPAVDCSSDMVPRTTFCNSVATSRQFQQQHDT